MGVAKTIKDNPVIFVLIIIIILIGVYFFTKNDDVYIKPEKCACSPQEANDNIEEGYDIGFVDGVNSVVIGDDIDEENTQYNKSSNDANYNGEWDQSKTFYTTRVMHEGKYVCPKNLIDTGMDWGMGPDSARQCRTQSAPQPQRTADHRVPDCPKGQYYSTYWKKCRYEADRGKTECPAGMWVGSDGKCTNGGNTPKPAPKDAANPKSNGCPSNKPYWDASLGDCAPVDCPDGQYWSSYAGKCRWDSDKNTPECGGNGFWWDNNKKKCVNASGAEINPSHVQQGKSNSTGGSKFLKKSGGVCPNYTEEVHGGKWGNWCKKTGEWNAKYMGKDLATGKEFYCKGGRTAQGNACGCDYNGGKVWNGSKCVCDKSRGLKWDNSKKQCVGKDGSSGSSGGGSSGGGGGSGGCKPGQHRRASDNKCVCVPPTKWDGSKCSGSGGGSSGGGGGSSGSGGSGGCKPGQHRRASDNKCVCIPPTKWNGSNCA